MRFISKPVVHSAPWSLNLPLFNVPLSCLNYAPSIAVPIHAEFAALGHHPIGELRCHELADLGV